MSGKHSIIDQCLSIVESFLGGDFYTKISGGPLLLQGLETTQKLLYSVNTGLNSPKFMTVKSRHGNFCFVYL